MNGVLPFPDIGEIALSIGPIDLRWYGMAYAVGLLLGWVYVRRLVEQDQYWGGSSGIKSSHIDDFLLWATLGVVLGGRAGYVLFYQPSYYFENPEKIFYLTEGGMAFHGAILTGGIVTYIFARVKDINFLSLADAACAAIPLGLFFGRIANFINGELWGRVTDVPWAMIFPDSDGQPRHPSQLYEAALEGILLFIILRFATHVYRKLEQPGYVAGLFLAGYGLARGFVEHFYRQPDLEHPISIHTPLTAGLLYSIPMVIIGIYLIYRSKTKTLAN
ncbi:MAG: prolipoprotein diacylglyceryl transferase [Rhizobiales bacterium]|nr:prolipoprotein diacylglyceryl transferase [Hyphomicrobiales bacterium]